MAQRGKTSGPDDDFQLNSSCDCLHAPRTLVISGARRPSASLSGRPKDNKNNNDEHDDDNGDIVH